MKKTTRTQTILQTSAATLTVVAIMSLSFLLISGCKMILPASPTEASVIAAPEAQVAPTEQQPAPQPVPEPTAPAVGAEQAAATAGGEAATATADATAEPELNISGSLKLQDDFELCPHLTTAFSCDRYDIRGCDFTIIMAQNSFYPNVLHCRDGFSSKREDPDHKYCLIQECKPLTDGNLVYAYGGMTAFAEYSYEKVRTATGQVSFNYNLKSCGEQEKEFPDINKCRYYRTESQLMI